MAAEDREAIHPLIRELEREPRHFSFFRAVWLLEKAHPGAPRVGDRGPARDEVVRLRPSSSLAFPSADVSKIERRDDPDEVRRYRITTPIMGLYGITSPMPTFYSEDILFREMREGEDDGRLFLDLLNHRLLSFLYKAWAKYRWEFTFEPGARDRTSQFLMGWLGLGTEGLQEAVGVPAGRLLRYAGAVTQRPHNAQSVAGLIADYFDVPVRLAQCVGRWVRVAAPDQNRLGAANSVLGESLTVGEKVLDRSSKCRIEIGPLPFERYERLRPGGQDFAALCAVARYMLPDALVFDLELLVERDTVPRPRVACEGVATRLGWSSWLCNEAPDEDKDVIFPAPAEAAAA